MLLDIITQNVDGLHQRAGASRVTELHGTAHDVRCLSCGTVYSRQHMQNQLHALNYWWVRKMREEREAAELRADGDAEISLLPEDEAAFRIPPCGACGGVLKTDVTFFGDALPASTKTRTLELAREADGVLVAGTSLMVLSAFRLVEEAARHGTPIAVVNLGETRLDKAGIEHLKVEAPCGPTLTRLADDLLVGSTGGGGGGDGGGGGGSGGGRAGTLRMIDDGGASARGGAGRSRATRRQKMDAEEVAATAAADRLREAATDRRGGWRASKAKGNRRNRRYENRLLQGVAESWEEYDLEP